MNEVKENYLSLAAECLKVLANPKRLEILILLRDAGSSSVGDISDACGILSNVASEHLRLLQRCGFLSSRREGRFIFYSISEPHLLELLACMERRFK